MIASPDGNLQIMIKIIKIKKSYDLKLRLRIKIFETDPINDDR